MDRPSRILIVDDDRVTRRILDGLLSPEGYELRPASNGAAALTLAREWIPDLILLDILMPGLDGFEVCRELRNDDLLAEMPIIMLTALDDRESRIKGMDAGADDFVSKPFDRVELLTRVRGITRLNRFRRILQERTQLHRAESELRRRVRELEVLNEVVTTTSTTLDVDTMLEFSSVALARVFAPAEVRALRGEGEGQDMHLTLCAQVSSQARPKGEDVAAKLSSVAIPAGHKPFEAKSLSYGPEMLEKPFPTQFETASVDGAALESSESEVGLALPILVRDTLFGIIEIKAKGENVSFDELDLILAQSVVTALGRSLETAELYQELQRYAGNLEQTVSERTQELASERDRTHAILEALGEAAFVTDVEGRLEYINPAGAALSGYEREEMIGLMFSEWHPDRRIERFLNDVGAGHADSDSWKGELVGRRKDGSYYDAVLTLAPLADPKDRSKSIGFVGIQRDITPLKEAERLKDRFVSNVSHELRTPLSAITLLSGNLDALDARLTPEKRKHMIKDIRKHAQVLDELIRDVLEISSLDSGRIRPQLEPLDLVPMLVEECRKLEPLAERDGLSIDAGGFESLMVEGDQRQLRRVVRNLVNNAIKYSPEGGTIRCSWREIECESPEVPAALAEPKLGRELPLRYYNRIPQKFRISQRLPQPRSP